MKKNKKLKLNKATIQKTNEQVVIGGVFSSVISFCVCISDPGTC